MKSVRLALLYLSSSAGVAPQHAQGPSRASTSHFDVACLSLLLSLLSSEVVQDMQSFVGNGSESHSERERTRNEVRASVSDGLAALIASDQRQLARMIDKGCIAARSLLSS